MNNEEQTRNNSEQSIMALARVSSISLIKEVLKKFFWGSYDNLGKLILANLFWFLFAIPLFALLFMKSRIHFSHFLILFFPFLILLAPATASVFNLTFQMIERKNVKVARDFFAGIKRYLKRGTVLSAITIIMFTVGFVDIWFYANLRSLKILSVILTVIGFWIVLLVALIQNYLFPLMVQRNLSIKDNLLNSIYLTFDSLGFSFAIFLISLAVWLIMGFSGLGILIFFISIPSFLYNLALKILLIRKYGMEGEIFEEKRGWKEFWFPWK